MTPSLRLRAALASLHRPANTLAPALGCHPRTVQFWVTGQNQPPAPVVAWVEAMAAACDAVPVPDVRIVAGRPRQDAR